MDIISIEKRDGHKEKYNNKKIKNAINRAFLSVNNLVEDEVLLDIVYDIEKKIKFLNQPAHVELIQDLVERTLMEKNFYLESKSYILYRDKHAKKRKVVDDIIKEFDDLDKDALKDILKKIQIDFNTGEYDLENLKIKFLSFININMTSNEKLELLIKAAVELTSKEKSNWEYISSRLLSFKHRMDVKNNTKQYNINSFYTKIKVLTENNLYGDYILKNYSQDEIDICENYIDNSRDELLNFSGLNLLIHRYVIKNNENKPLETPQEMYMGISLHLAMNEKNNRLEWVKKFYDILSTLKVTMATPTLSNSRKPFNQLSSCFIDTVPDSLSGIYHSIDNFATVSKFGGGMGLYFGKVRSKGSSIRGFKGAAGGIIGWIKLANDTAVAVDQLGVRQGAVAVYLDVWHKDLLEFLALKTNNGDDRMKAHDIFTGVCYPDLFWKTVKNDIEGNWYLMCPHEIKEIKGYSLEDYWGTEWEEKYKDCILDSRISKKVVPIKDLVRLIIKSVVETGTPFAFNRDIVNKYNPNSHKGIIYCSNLCTEIAQNMSEIENIEQTIENISGEEIVITKRKPGDFVVCNLASLSLGKIDVNNDTELSETIKIAVRALDNVIDLNLFPLPYAKLTSSNYRPIGLGVSGYHHMLVKNRITWESENHLKFADKIFEKINYEAISASCNLAIEKGKYKFFEGSDWHTGDYFEKRNYNSDKWLKLKEKVSKNGLRNAWIMAIAPTSSTSIIVGTTAGVDPVMNLFFLEEKKNMIIPRVVPELTLDTQWYYKSSYSIDQSWSIKAAGIRQRHIDQSQSVNIYITNDYSFRKILDLYILAFDSEVKTIYYVRSKSLEVEECTVCAS